MFGYDNVHSMTVYIGDPGADVAVIGLLRAPKGGITITNMEAVSGVALTAGAGTMTELTVYNGGTSGTATTVIGTALGGTAITWTAGLPKAFSLGDGTMSEGQYLWAKYDEEGTVAPKLSIFIEYRIGIAD